MNKALAIFYNAIPVLLMMGLIPLIDNDWLLTALFVIIIAVSFLVHNEKRDAPILVFGFLAMTISESVFVSLGVESFLRRSLFGLMPVWLPFLWAYSFVAMKRAVLILSRHESRM